MGSKATIESSKIEELQILERFAHKQEKGTYLRDFLTDTLIQWFHAQMRDDLSCDIMHWMVHWQCLASERAGNLTDAQRANRDLQASLEHAQVQIKELAKQGEDCKAQRDRLSRWLADYSAEAEQRKTDLIAVRIKLGLAEDTLTEARTILKDMA